jgi:ABC-type lipoprotein release transport system permease subunit
MTMTVMERVREIGTLMAVGTTRLRIMGMFVVEGLGARYRRTGLVLGYAMAIGLTRAGSDAAATHVHHRLPAGDQRRRPSGRQVP